MDTSILVRLTEQDAATIRRSASIRQLTVSEFIRRAGLGRRADVDMETEIIVALSGVVRTMRDLHAVFVHQGIVPPDDVLRPIITHAVAAMDRIEGKRALVEG